MNGGEEEYIDHGWESQKERDHYEEQDIGDLNGMDWIDLAQDIDQWRALVNMVMNFQVP
jgi:hypothetical protein